MDAGQLAETPHGTELPPTSIGPEKPVKGGNPSKVDTGREDRITSNP